MRLNKPIMFTFAVMALIMTVFLLPVLASDGDTEGMIHLANVVLGGVLYAVVNISQGTPALAAVVQSLIAVVSAIGGHELIDFLASGSGRKSSA